MIDLLSAEEKAELVQRVSSPTPVPHGISGTKRRELISRLDFDPADLDEMEKVIQENGTALS
jgi:hypothetical protein